jgi:hypothetical protein
VKVAVTSVVVLDVEGLLDVGAFQRALYASNAWGVGKMWRTVTGLVYRVVRIESLTVVEVRE